MMKYEYKFEIEAPSQAQADALFKKVMEFTRTQGAELVAFDLRRVPR